MIRQIKWLIWRKGKNLGNRISAMTMMMTIQQQKNSKIK